MTNSRKALDIICNFETRREEALQLVAEVIYESVEELIMNSSSREDFLQKLKKELVENSSSR